MDLDYLTLVIDKSRSSLGATEELLALVEQKAAELQEKLSAEQQSKIMEMIKEARNRLTAVGNSFKGSIQDIDETEAPPNEVCESLRRENAELVATFRAKRKYQDSIEEWSRDCQRKYSDYSVRQHELIKAQIAEEESLIDEIQRVRDLLYDQTSLVAVSPSVLPCCSPHHQQHQQQQPQQQQQQNTAQQLYLSQMGNDDNQQQQQQQDDYSVNIFDRALLQDSDQMSFLHELRLPVPQCRQLSSSLATATTAAAAATTAGSTVAAKFTITASTSPTTMVQLSDGIAPSDYEIKQKPPPPTTTTTTTTTMTNQRHFLEIPSVRSTKASSQDSDNANDIEGFSRESGVSMSSACLSSANLETKPSTQDAVEKRPPKAID